MRLFLLFLPKDSRQVREKRNSCSVCVLGGRGGFSGKGTCQGRHLSWLAARVGP